MTSRRAMLVAGGGALIIAGGAGWSLTRAPQRARRPWETARDGFGAEPILDFLAYALLAPNPHNMQPWMVALGDDKKSFGLYANPERTLPETDPPSRQITIGLGCFLEIFRQAAAMSGWRVDIDPFPEGADPARLDARPVAAVRMVEDASVAADRLFASVLARRTNRAPFDSNRSVSTADLNAIAAAGAGALQIGHTNEPERVAALRSLAIDAWHTEWSTAAARKESVDVTRIGKAEIDAAPWGLSLPGAMMEALNVAGVMTREKMNQPGSLAYEESVKFYDNACATAAAFLWSVTGANTRIDQLEAGRAWVRMHLQATELGIAFHPLSQALQEFPEMAPHYARAHEMLAPEGGTAQMLVRLGYAKAPLPAPREHLAAKLIEF